VPLALAPQPAATERCEQLQLRLAETEEQLAAREEAACLVLHALAQSGDPVGAEQLKQLAHQAHSEALRALEHAAALRQRFADAAHGRALRAAERVASLRDPLWQPAT
jgi:hypothetical protein